MTWQNQLEKIGHGDTAAGSMNLPEGAGLGLILAQKESKFVTAMLIIVMIGNKYYTVYRMG